MQTKIVKIGDHEVGGENFSLFAGPCSIESEAQLQTTADHVKLNGAQVLRGGVFKLRTSPDSFQGLGENAFEMVKSVKKSTNMPFITEVTDPRQIGDLMDIADCFQVGSRNMHNYELLKELGTIDKPVMLKRGFSGLIKEWLYSAEYIQKNGNDNVILCERGIRTFETQTRNTFDISAIAFVKQNTNLPIIADPSHATGIRSLVKPMALAAAAAGADGVIIEVHPDPDKAFSDGMQTLNFNEFTDLTNSLNKLVPVLRSL